MAKLTPQKRFTFSVNEWAARVKPLVLSRVDPTEWTRLIAEAVCQTADWEYQKRSWFGLSATEVGSADETFSRLFDDVDFDDFLKSPTVRLTDRQRELGDSLKDRMNLYASQTPEHLNDAEVFGDPAWEEIRQAARRFLDALEFGQAKTD